MTILGTYLSRYQGKITAEAVSRMIGAGVRFVGLRLTSGAGYIDNTWEHNAAMLRDTSILLFPWHFVTTDNAARQYQNFIGQVDKFDRWRLPPGLDCEAYTAVGGYTYAIRDLEAFPQAHAEFMRAAIDQGLKMGWVGDQDTFAVWQTYGLAYPTEATVDAMGRELTAWMAAQDELADFDYPSIYTNASSGDRIFKSASMVRYLLWVANWHSAGKPPLTAPNLPAVWKGQPWYIWQDAIIDGAPYGIQGQVSHELWGPLCEFPGDEPDPPPPPDDDTIEVTIKTDGKVYSGILEAV